jgi:Uncharacterized protein conserved in bacteria
MPESQPHVVVIAGPNGAGKTTHAEALLKTLDIQTFVNADYIARGLSGLNTEAVNFEAGRIMLKRLHELAEQQENFSFESTLSSRSFALFLQQLKNCGYQITLFYFSLSSASLAYRRVRHRVKMGGHDIPQKTITRRYYRSIKNLFDLYMNIADNWIVFDNSGDRSAKVVAIYSQQQTQVLRSQTWQQLKRIAQTR